MRSKVRMLNIFIDESDRLGDLPLYEAIVRRLAQSDVKGATVHAGIMGFGRRHRVHGKRLLGVSDDRPIVIVVVDEEPVLRTALAQIRPMVKEGLFLLLDAEILE